jgi:hypothetical protein
MMNLLSLNHLTGVHFLVFVAIGVKKKSLYGLKRAPQHWYKLFSTILQSPEIGLKPTKHDPCIFYGTIIPGKPPLYLAIYIDDFLYFSLDDEG